MKLYHGSHVEVRNPKILTASRVGDFGNGFYTTSSLEQAACAASWVLALTV